MDATTLKHAAAGFGADLAGIAPVARFAHLPPRRNPLAVFPQAKSMVVVGRKIPRGTLRGASAAYQRSGFMALEDNLLAKTTYDLCIWIEAWGFEAVPMFGYDAEEAGRMEFGVPVAPDKPAPNVYVDWMLAAHAAGLGATGRNGLFITPQFGTRQRFAMLLSDYEFEPDAACGIDFCAGCDACEAACPSAALDNGVRDNAKCRACQSGAVQAGCGRFNTVDRIGAACGIACLAALESRGLVAETFANKLVPAHPGRPA